MANIVLLVANPSREKTFFRKMRVRTLRFGISPFRVAPWRGSKTSQQHSHRDQLPLERIEDQPNALQGRCAKKWLVAFFPENYRRRAAFALEFKISISNSTADGGSVCESKIDCAMRTDAELLQCGCGHKTINRAGVDQKIDGRLPSRTAAFLHNKPLPCQSHCS